MPKFMAKLRQGVSQAVNLLSAWLKKHKQPTPLVVTTIRITSGLSSPVTMNGLNQSIVLTADVRDQFNHPMTSGIALVWVSSDVTIAQIQAPSGLSTRLFSLSAGTVQITASAGGVTSATFPVIVAATPPPAVTKIITLSGSLVFGSVLTGSTSDRTLTIGNTGTGPLTVTSVSYPAGFTGAFSGIVPSGTQQAVTVTFAPVAVTSYSGTVTVNCDLTSGVNTTGASGTGTAATTRIIGLSGSLVYGDVTVNTTAVRTLTVTNTGSSTLNVSGLSCPSGFSGAFAGTIAPNAHQDITVTFAPTTIASYGGTVTVSSDATSGTNTLGASGAGIAAPPPPAGNVLAPANLRYVGCIRMPNAGTDTQFNYGGITGRQVGLQTRIFVTGSVVASGANPPDVYELDVTGLTPNPIVTSAPRATLVTTWPNIYHGKRQSWEATPPFAEQDLTGQNSLILSLYWHETLQQLFWSYAFSYTNIAPWSVGFSTLDNPNTGASTAYGPFKFSATDSDGTHLGGRAHWMTVHPTTGKMLMGGITKSGAADLSLGPTLYGDPDWPTPATPSGQNMSAIVQAGKYLTYYFHLFPPHGEPSNPLRVFQYDGVLTYPFEYAPAQSSDRVDPTLNSGKGTWSNNDNVGGAFWFEGTNRRGVLFFGTLMAGHSADPTDPTTCHEYYDNPGQMGVNLSSVIGAFTFGETVTGGTSGHSGSIQGIDVVTPALWLAQAGNQGDLIVGETVTGGTSGAHGVVTYFRRNDPVCSHGFAPAVGGITGPVSTKSVPVIIIYDPDKLNAVKAGTATDYAQASDYIIDVEATYGVVTGGQAVIGGAKQLSGYYYDPAKKWLYLNANRADNFRVSPSFQEELIHVFEILDTP